MIDNGVVLQKDGSLLAGWQFRGPDLGAATEREMTALSQSVSDALLAMGDGWLLHADAIRRPAQGYSAGQFPNRATQLIDDERRAAYAAAGARFETGQVLILTYVPPAEVYSRLQRWFVRGSVRPTVDWDVILGQFQRAADAMAGRLRSRLTLERLGSDALCTHLHECLTGATHSVRTPPDGIYLNLALANLELVGGFEPWMGARAVRVVALQAYPPSTEPNGLAFLAELPVPLRWSTRVIPLSSRTAATMIRRTQLRWFQKRKGAGSWLREMAARKAGGQSAAQEQTEELFTDHDAVRMAGDAADAVAENARGNVRFCLATQAVVIMDSDAESANRSAQTVVARLADEGYVARVETVNAVEAFLGTLPGHGTPNVRRAMVTSLNVADMLPLSTVWPGLASNPSPYFPRRTPPLLWAATGGSTPFRVNLHDSDVGHTLLFGATGAGKSTLVGLIAAQWQRYAGAQVFVFDVGYSGWLLCQATGGTHYDVGTGEGLGFQPLARVDDPAERAWATDWVETVLALQGVTVTPAMRERIDRGLSLVARAPVAHRTLTELVVQCQDPTIAAALRSYTISGPYGALLDSGEDMAEGGSHQTFELKALLDWDDRILVPVLLYLFRRVERRLDGRPTLIVIEELWGPLVRSVFASRIRQWLLTLRKQNAAVLLVAHSPAQLEGIPHAQVIWESCPTRIFLPNADASAPATAAVYSRLGLTAREIATIAKASPKRQYYFVSPRGRRLFDLELGPIALRLLAGGRGTQEEVRARAAALMEQYGQKEWLDHWLGGSTEPMQPMEDRGGAR
jgi:type IV secretion system protein VirB4